MMKDRVAIVTGGTRGMGKSIVTHLLEEGCDVVATGTKEYGDVAAGAQYACLDLADTQSVERFVREVVERTPFDILVNNAGINIIEAIDEIQDAHWHNVLEVNLTGAMRLMRAVSQVIKRGGRGGRIVNIASIWGVISKPKRNAYSAAKAGLLGLTRAAALDLAPYGILVNAVCPGFTKTELTASTLKPEEMRELAAQVPMGRFAEVDEIARVVVFLCSDLNTYITGQQFVVDGGFTIR